MVRPPWDETGFRGRCGSDSGFQPARSPSDRFLQAKLWSAAALLPLSIWGGAGGFDDSLYESGGYFVARARRRAASFRGAFLDTRAGAIGPTAELK
jgi:hypothetical protein